MAREALLHQHLGLHPEASMKSVRLEYRIMLLLAALLCLANPVGSAQNITASSAYQAVSKELTATIKEEMKDKQLPALSIALIDGQSIVWAQGFGYEDAKRMVPASAHTVYRVGSVSKLFTDLAVMHLVEAGKLDLDAPVARYIPGFTPLNPFGGDITLRELMSHRSGLIREPPVGNYFDTSSPALRNTITSLNRTSLVFPPGSHTKYSNAGIATVGYVIEETTGRPFADYLEQHLLDVLGMRESSFAPHPDLVKRLADAWMWSYDGLSFPAPKFQLGEAPAGAMYTTVTDLGRFVSVLFAIEQGSAPNLLHPETLRQMWSPQFNSKSEPATFGIGFRLGVLDGDREVDHGGAIYGFATELAALPDAALGVVVVTNVDCANAVMNHIAQDSLRLMRAQQLHRAAHILQPTKPVPAEYARKLAGRYEDDSHDIIRLEEQNGKVFMRQMTGGYLVPLRASDGGDLVADGRISYSPQPIHPQLSESGDPSGIIIASKTYRRLKDEVPAPPPAQLTDFIGEYGWDFDKLYILESRGRLEMLVEWFEFASLEPRSGDNFKVVGRGLYGGEDVVFHRDQGKITAVQVGGVSFPKLPTSPPGSVFQIQPLKPVSQLRAEALASIPPREAGTFKKPDLVELTSLDPTIKLDIRYATDRNFLASPVYLQARAFMQRPAAEAVARASQRLHAMGYGLLIHDAYRPWYVTKMFWDGTPEDKHIFVANPAEGSRHNRGCAVDLTLYDLKTGAPIQMTGGYDEMSERSYPFYPGGTSIERWHRDLLRRTMENEGFSVFEYEWWHFDFHDWQSYPILNLTFEQLG